MSNKPEISKKILEMLGKKVATSVPEIKTELTKNMPQKAVYAVSRAITDLEDSGYLERLESGRTSFARLTKEGKKKLSSHKLDSKNSLVSPAWDGYWRIVILDLPENRKKEREALRYLLIKAGFVCLKNSVWISMYPFEHFFTNLKKDLELTSEMIILVTDKIDPESEKEFFQSFGK